MAVQNGNRCLDFGQAQSAHHEEMALRAESAVRSFGFLANAESATV